MPRKCTVCNHGQVGEINQALLDGASFRNVAENFSLSITALHRHKQHIPADLTKAQEAQAVARADSLLDQVISLRDKALSLLETAEQAGELRTALQGIKEARGCLELLAKLQGELRESTTVNVLVNPQWVTVRAVILQALGGYSEAKNAVVQALQGVEGNAGK